MIMTYAIYKWPLVIGAILIFSVVAYDLLAVDASHSVSEKIGEALNGPQEDVDELDEGTGKALFSSGNISDAHISAAR